MLTKPRLNLGARIAAILLSAVFLSCGGGGGIAVSPTTPSAPTVSFIRFATQPGNSIAGQSFSVSVELVSATGVRVTTSSDAVSLSVTGGATIAGSTTVNATGGLATFSGVSLTKAGSSFQITATSGSYTATSNAFAVNAGAASPTHSLFTPSSFLVNVATTITFTFRDVYDNPTPSATVSLSTAAAGSTFTPASGTTGTDGTFVTSFRTSTGGSVPLSATVGGVSVAFAASVTSTLGSVFVNIKNSNGALLPATTYTLTYSGGSQLYTTSTGADFFNNNVPAGAISVTANKSGYNTGAASGTLVAGGSLTLNVVMAVTSNVCLPAALTLPANTNGSLTASSCLQGTQPTALYQFSLGATSGVRFTLTPTGFSPVIAVTQNPPTQRINAFQNSPVPVQQLWLLPAGTFQLRAGSISGLGAFTLTGTVDAGLLTTSTVGGVIATAVNTCPVNANLITSVTTSGQSLATTDCIEVQGSSSFYYDAYRVYSPNACTITMRSAAFDAFLEAWDITTGTLVRADDDTGGGTDAQLTLTACNNSGNILEIRANSYNPQATGAYTLTVAILGGATFDISSSSVAGPPRDRTPDMSSIQQALLARRPKIPK